jgi:AhpD family alkylhydroperoxidase
MPRIAYADPGYQIDPNADPGEQTNGAVAAIMAHRPEAAHGLSVYMAAYAKSSLLSPRLRELVRLRIAFHNQCRSCMAVRYGDAVADGVTEDLVCSLERPMEAPDLTEAERAALRYADLFATNHLAIDDAVYDNLRQYFDDAEIVDLGLLCAFCVGMGRLCATWHVTDVLPERFRADGVVTPWGSDALVVG